MKSQCREEKQREKPQRGKQQRGKQQRRVTQKRLQPQPKKEEEDDLKARRIKKKSLTISPSEIERKLKALEKEEYNALNKEIQAAGYVKGGLIRDEWGTVGRVGTVSLKPSWYKEAYNGRNHREIVKSRAIYQLETENPEYNQLKKQYKEITGRTYYGG